MQQLPASCSSPGWIPLTHRMPRPSHMSINMKMRLPEWSSSSGRLTTGLTCGNKCTRKLPTYVILVSIIYQADVLQFFLLLRPGREPESDQDMSRSRTQTHMCADSVTVTGNCHFSVSPGEGAAKFVIPLKEWNPAWLIERSSA